MANILVNIEKGIEVGAEDILGWLGAAQKKINLAPQAVAALAVLLGQVALVVKDVAADAASPINIVLQPQQINDVKAVWPDIEAFALALGIKL